MTSTNYRDNLIDPVLDDEAMSIIADAEAIAFGSSGADDGDLESMFEAESYDPMSDGEDAYRLHEEVCPVSGYVYNGHLGSSPYTDEFGVQNW